jgi:hypothetical protein
MLKEEKFQHFNIFFFLPSEPRSFIFWMYSVADGTLQAVSPMSTVTPAILFAVAMASAVSGMT